MRVEKNTLIINHPLPPSSSWVCKCTWILRMSRNVYVSNTTHTIQPNVRNTLRALHQVFEMNVRLRRRVICRRSFNGVGARDDEHESESDEHMSLRFRLTPTTGPVNASSSFRLRIFLPPPPLPTMADDLLLTSLLIGSSSIRPHDKYPARCTRTTAVTARRRPAAAVVPNIFFYLYQRYALSPCDNPITNRVVSTQGHRCCCYHCRRNVVNYRPVVEQVQSGWSRYWYLPTQVQRTRSDQ